MWLRKALWIVVLAIVAELASIIVVGNWIGAWPTFGLLLLGAAVGGSLARSEGRKRWEEARRLMQEGKAPGHAVLDGLCVVAGGVLLAVPGFLSDLVGLTLLLPFTRPLYRLAMFAWLQKRFRSGAMRVYRGPFGR